MPRRNPHGLLEEDKVIWTFSKAGLWKQRCDGCSPGRPRSPLRNPAHCQQSPADGCRALPAPTCATAVGTWRQGHWPVLHWRKQNSSPFKRRTLLSMLPLFLTKCNSQSPAGWISLSLTSQRSSVYKFSHDDSWKTEMLRLLNVTLNSSYTRTICRSRCFSQQGSVVLRSSYGADIWKDVSIPPLAHGSHIFFPSPDSHLTASKGSQPSSYTSYQDQALFLKQATFVHRLSLKLHL